MKAKKTSVQLADGRKLIRNDEHPSADRQIQDTHDLGRTTVRSEIRYDPLLGATSWCPGALASAAAKVLILFIIGQRFIIEGVSRSGLKGKGW